MSEAPAIGLGIVVVAIVAALAGGAASQSSDAGSSTAAPRAAAGTAGAGSCTGLDTLTSGDGASYTQYPVSAGNSLGCTLHSGDRGEPVAALQRALALCMHRAMSADGVYGTQTAAAVSALGGAKGGYGPSVAKAMLWPWFSASTRTFNGRCSAATTST